MEYVFLIVLIGFAGYILYLIKSQNRNAWDALFLNSTIGILTLFMIGVLVNDKEVWLRIVSFIGVVATGSALASSFLKVPPKK